MLGLFVLEQKNLIEYQQGCGTVEGASGGRLSCRCHLLAMYFVNSLIPNPSAHCETDLNSPYWCVIANRSNKVGRKFTSVEAVVPSRVF